MNRLIAAILIALSWTPAYAQAQFETAPQADVKPRIEYQDLTGKHVAPVVIKKTLRKRAADAVAAKSEEIYDHAKAYKAAHPKQIKAASLAGRGLLFVLQCTSAAGNTFRWGN